MHWDTVYATLWYVLFYAAASLDKLQVDMDGRSVPLTQLAQIGMPNPNTIILNMATYPQVYVTTKPLQEHNIIKKLVFQNVLYNAKYHCQ